MIQIGNKIWITDNLNDTEFGKVRATDSKVYFEGTQVNGINYLNISYDANEGMGKKQCTIYLMENADKSLTERFAQELCEHGFNVEIIYTFGDFRHVEYYILGGERITEVKPPSSQ